MYPTCTRNRRLSPLSSQGILARQSRTWPQVAQLPSSQPAPMICMDRPNTGWLRQRRITALELCNNGPTLPPIKRSSRLVKGITRLMGTSISCYQTQCGWRAKKMVAFSRLVDLGDFPDQYKHCFCHLRFLSRITQASSLAVCPCRYYAFGPIGSARCARRFTANGDFGQNLEWYAPRILRRKEFKC